MATADSVKAKIQGLIDAANTKTGKADADLTTAIASLVDGYGSGGDGKAEAYLAMLNGTDIPSEGGTLRIPDGVSRIAGDFYNGKMVGIRNVTVILPNGVKTLGVNAFRQFGFGAASTGGRMVLNDDLEDVGNYALYACNFASFDRIPSGLKVIGGNAFQNSCNATSDFKYDADLELPNIEQIGANAFGSFGFVGSNVHLGSKISSIGANAFQFKDSPAFTLTIDRAEDAISGAPWGATNATIVWAGDV